MPHLIRSRAVRWLAGAATVITAVFAVSAGLNGQGGRPAQAATGGVAVKPIMGWSSWSFYRGPGTQTEILAQANAMRTSLESHGYTYINLDAGWSNHVDGNGRDTWNTKLFPAGIPSLAAKLHARGLKLGLYLNPGIRQSVVAANLPILGTKYHAKDIADTSTNGNTLGSEYWRIDYTKPGAQQYIQSYVDLFASWGVDYVKMDFVGPGGGNAKADNRPDMQAWHQAIVKNGRPIVLELSNSLSFADAATWKQTANGWRIDGDIECYSCESGGSYPLTSWAKLVKRFTDLPKWTPFAGTGGWNDLDSLEVGNGTNDGLTPDQRRSAVTLWSIGCAPLLLGTDLTHLDSADLPLITNDEVIAVNQAGVSGRPVTGATNGTAQVWAARQPDGSYAVALFNTATSGTQSVTVTWRQLGVKGPAKVRDLWSRSSLGSFPSSFTAKLGPGASRLVKVTGS